jgi:hypothetical protein
VDCEDTDAILLAVLANVSHGMPFLLADHKAAAVRVLRTTAKRAGRFCS